MSREPWWQPDRFARRRAALEARARIATGVRAFFAGEDFLEVETPALQVSPGLEPHLFAFETRLRDPHAGAERALYLRTSPEFTLKKLLVAGLPRIFELAPAFRNAERSSTHHPEFTLLEWYRTGATYEALWRDCECLLRIAADAAGVPLFRWPGRGGRPRAPAERTPLADALLKPPGGGPAGLPRGPGEGFADR